MPEEPSPPELIISPYLPEHRAQVESLVLNSFRVDEPLTNYLKITSEDSEQCFKDVAVESLNEVSFVALDPAAENRVIGCRLCTIKNRDASTKVLYDFSSSRYTGRIQIIMDYLAYVSSDLFQLIPKTISKLLKFELVSVETAYRRRQVAKKLVDASIQKAREIGCDGVVVVATSFKTQALFEKMHFETLKTVRNRDYVDAISGDKPFANISEENELTELMILYL